MEKTIIWRKGAYDEFQRTAQYLEAEVSFSAAEKFVENVELTLEKITKNPETYRFASKKLKVQYLNMDKNRQLFYRNKKTIIEVIAIFDTRQDPKKRPF